MALELLVFFSYILCLFLSFFSLFYLFAIYKQSYWLKRGVYTPSNCHWFFGHFKDAFLLKKSFSQVFEDLYSTNTDSPVIGIYMLQKPFLIVRDPELIKQMFIKDFNVFCNRYFASKRKADIIGSSNLFSIDNPKWKYLRSKLSPAFSMAKSKKLVQLMLKSTDGLMNHLSSQTTDGKTSTIECRQLSDKYTTDVITSFAFGIQTNSYLNTEFYDRSRVIFDMTVRRVILTLSVFFFPRIADIMNGTFLDSSEEFFRNVFWKSMNEREKSRTSERGDIIDLLIDLKNEKQDPEFSFKGDYLVAQAAIILFAGIETSATTMGFTLLELAKNPSMQTKVRHEIQEIIAENGFTYEALLNMKYLNQVVCETLRLYPPLPIIDRVASENYKIPDTSIVLEKGTAVYAIVNGLHKDPQFFRDPHTFNPDRFSEELKQNIKSCTYMPFGEGPRKCIGMRMGQLQSVVGLATILNNYEVALNSQYVTKISKKSMILAPENGIRLDFKRISLL
ncbi:cytochrome P450 6k1-like isoform X1 [Trichogramma pretiosum]|uniref:cytochrome P450 6k1-like isoform X1 n=1 Tax=Trichogramma pretiosum TaxID=7493 RepID=UPI0006C9694E|nr:cytochrome P450 6k1-like isoform X1 [Trichogramma pretiosum]